MKPADILPDAPDNAVVPPPDDEEGVWSDVGLSAWEYRRIVDLLGREPNGPGAGDVRRHVVRALQLQEHPRAAAAAADGGRAGGARTGRKAGAIRVGRRTVVFKIESTIIPPLSSRTTAPPRAWAAFSGTFSPWGRGPWRCWNRCGSAGRARPASKSCWKACVPASGTTRTAWACPPWPAKSGLTTVTKATAWSTPWPWAWPTGRWPKAWRKGRAIRCWFSGGPRAATACARPALRPRSWMRRCGRRGGRRGPAAGSEAGSTVSAAASADDSARATPRRAGG